MLVSYLGTWMNDVGAGWLMATLAPSPAMVALVQTAATLPVLLFSLPAGALADIVDRRQLLIWSQSATALIVVVFTLMVWTGRVTPLGLLVFTFLLGTGLAVFAPTRNAIVPKLVPHDELQAAVVLNGVGVNVSRAIGPVVAGLVIAAWGVAAPFALNALSFVAVILAFLWWHPPPEPPTTTPNEQLWGAMAAGLRYARASAPLHDTLSRAAAFFVFAGSVWALLPLIAKHQLAGGSALFGILNGCIGAGAVLGALLLPRLRRRIDPDCLVAGATVVVALALLLLAAATNAWMAGSACLMFGAAWVGALASLNVSAQVALPDWVRARGMSLFLMVVFGSMSIGSALWGQIADHSSIPAALLIAAAGAVLGVPLMWRARLHQGAALDLAPASNWPAPMVSGEIPEQKGPVMVTIEYRIREADCLAFVTAMDALSHARRRAGAFTWGLFEDAAEPGRFLEYFMEASWAEHLRHHARVTQSDRQLHEAARAFHVGNTPPAVAHFIPPRVCRLPDEGPEESAEARARS